MKTLITDHLTGRTPKQHYVKWLAVLNAEVRFYTNSHIYNYTYITPPWALTKHLSQLLSLVPVALFAYTVHYFPSSAGGSRTQLEQEKGE